PSVTAAVQNTTTPAVSSTRHGRRPRVTTGAPAAATNASVPQGTASARGPAASSASAATSSQGAGPSTRARTTGAGSSAATATHAGTRTAPTSPGSTARPAPTPQPAAIPTGTYSLSDGNRTCVKAVMGLQLMARNAQQEQMEYVTVNPNATKISGSCGMVQSELSLTFSGGIVNLTFVK
ncbi:LAMP3 protein, partial [Sitta europaea]|nr:LAMP3 protein [Sitta europaea]